MKFLIIGLGSMGKRRIRNLQALGHDQIAGYDLNVERCKESESKYDIKVFDSFEFAIQQFKPDALIISTSPQYHMDYAWKAVEYNISCFIEASVVESLRILELARLTADKNIIIAPSCTMRYFSGPKKIKELILQKAIGKPLNINYHTGQYLPDWHPWEPINNYYVSCYETGGAREIVPFELTWINDIFGDPIPLSCVKSKISELDVEIDDIYHCVLKYPHNVLANITIDVISRPFATRELRILGTEGEIVMSSDENCVRYANAQEKEWVRFSLVNGTIEDGYINPEEPYIAEMSDFISAIKNNNKLHFPNTLNSDGRILEILSELESLAEEI